MTPGRGRSSLGRASRGNIPKLELAMTSPFASSVFLSGGGCRVVACWSLPKPKLLR